MESMRSLCLMVVMVLRGLEGTMRDPVRAGRLAVPRDYPRG